MMQYQSFPDSAGASQSFDKLKTLHLPDLAGKRFLDVGCNEGFFCGYAHFQGAKEVVGLDHSSSFIERARTRFPDCDFRQASWNNLPDQEFDVILLASALHYAADQVALIKNLVERLSRDGVLVLELGVVPSREEEWRTVQRDIDERVFPSMLMLRRILAGYAWKWMGPGVAQGGDPVPRHVLHVSRRRPVAYLLLQPPGYGKTSLATGLFVPAGVNVISGDQRIAQLANGQLQGDARLTQLIKSDYSPYALDKIIAQIFDMQLADSLVRVWLDEVDPHQDIAIDAYVPKEYRNEVESRLKAHGYMPVQLCWERIGYAPLSEDEVEARASAFYMGLFNKEEQARATPGVDVKPQGVVDEVDVQPGCIVIRGWAVDSRGRLPETLKATVKRQSLELVRLERQLRPDVQQHLGLPQPLVGYRLICRPAAAMTRKQVLDGLQVCDHEARTKHEMGASVFENIGEA